MDNKQKREWLNQYRDNEFEINRLTEEIQHWASLALKVTTSYSAVPGQGGGDDRLQSSVEEIALLQGELLEKINLRIELRRVIENAIEALSDIRYKKLLRLRYIDGRKWKQVALDMGHSYDYVKELHGNALATIKVPTLSHRRV